VTTKEFSAIFLGATRSGMAEPKETVRNALPQTPEVTTALQDNGARLDLARIPLPARTPAVPPHRPPPAIAMPPSVMVSPILQSLPKPGFDSIPRSFCWALLGISALIFLIQIWNYALS
jgi:hypothetical protein